MPRRRRNTWSSSTRPPTHTNYSVETLKNTKNVEVEKVKGDISKEGKAEAEVGEKEEEKDRDGEGGGVVGRGKGTDACDLISRQLCACASLPLDPDPANGVFVQSKLPGDQQPTKKNRKRDTDLVPSHHPSPPFFISGAGARRYWVPILRKYITLRHL